MTRKRSRGQRGQKAGQPARGESAPELTETPWRIRYAEEVLTKDVRGIGQAEEQSEILERLGALRTMGEST